MGLFIEQSEVFAVAFAVLAAGAVILTLNVLLLVNLSLWLYLMLICLCWFLDVKFASELEIP